MEYPENIEIQKLDEQYQKIASAVADTQATAMEASERLPALKVQLGETILRAALGEARDADVNAARFAVLNAEREIEAGELILEPARRAQARLSGAMQNASRKRGYRREYAALKTKITEAGTATWGDTSTLRDLCLMLNGSHDEADAFLANLTKAA